MRKLFDMRGAAVLALALAGCGAPQPRPGAPGPGAVRPPAEPGAHYRIDPTRSELRVLVHRAGPMAALGHNHVLSTRSIQGWALFDGTPAHAAFFMSLPVASFVVDDPALRAAEGADFAEPVGEDARSGTRHNLLGPAVLDASRFPAITLRSVRIESGAGVLEATVAIEVAGHESQALVPFALDASAPGRLAAEGAVTLRQSALGLTPFSVFLGALRVEDDLRIEFRIAATSG